MALEAGTRLGPYEIVGPLGAGGMGEVYRARDTRLAREVAVKVLPPHLADTPEARTRFEREAKAISSLNHPHICTLHDVGREGETDYLVMELVDGETLAQRITRGALPPDEVLRLGLQIADALDKAHRQGLVHRDLKPGNVMLTRSGAKLLDFGLARSTGLGPVTNLSSTPTQTRALTAEGAIVGTFQYMSPEQLEGREADARSDVWALGVVLYESLTGRKAFEGASQAKLIGAIMNTDPPPVSTISALVPPAMDRLLRSCLAKDPDERIQTAHDVKLQLQWLLEGGSQIGVPMAVATKRRRRDRLVTSVAAVSTLGLLAVLGWLATRRAPAAQVIRFEIVPPGSLRTIEAPRVSPDGRMIAYDATDSTGTFRIYLRPLEGFDATPLAGTEGAHRPFWSPDSKYLGFVADGKVKKVDVTGGPPAVLCDAPTGSDGTWSTGGVILFDGGTSDPIRRVSAGGGIAAVQVVADTAHGIAQVGWPEFLPDGRHFLYLSIGNDPHLWVGSLDGKKPKDLGPCESQIKYVRPGYLLFSRAGALVAQRFDTRGLRFVGEPVPIAQQVTAGVNGASEFHASDNGVLVFSASLTQAARLVEMDRLGRQTRTFTLPAGILHPRLSPDGRRVALRVLDGQSRARDLWVIELDRDVSSRFTFDPGNENNPLWSADGRSIVFWSTGNTPRGLVRKDFSGAAQTELLVPIAEGDYQLSDMTRDGAQVLATVNGEARQYVTRITLADKKVERFLTGPYNVEDASLSPDGRFMVYNSDESGRHEVYVQPFPDRSDKWRVSTAGGLEACWSADGKQIYYLSADQKLMSVPVKTTPAFEPGIPQSLFPLPVVLPDAGRPQYCPNADGSRFVALVPASYRTLPSTYVVVNWTEALRRK